MNVVHGAGSARAGKTPAIFFVAMKPRSERSESVDQFN